VSVSADELAIRRLLEAYADAVFRRDAEAWGVLWDEDAVWRLLGQEVRGRAAIVAAWSEAMRAFPVAAFFVQPGPLEIAGDAAQGRSYTNEVLRTADGAVRRVVGRYEDRFVRRGAGWLFAARSFSILMEH